MESACPVVIVYSQRPSQIWPWSSEHVQLYSSLCYFISLNMLSFLIDTLHSGRLRRTGLIFSFLPCLVCETCLPCL